MDTEDLMDTDKKDLEHEACWQLLPWLANNRLAGDELTQVLDHLKTCSLCRQELSFLPELRFAVEETFHGNDDASSRSVQGHRNVADRITAYEQQQNGATKSWVWWNLPQLLSRIFSQTWGPRVLAIQALLIVLLALPWMSASLRPWAGSLEDGTMSQTSPETAAGTFRTLTSDPHHAVDGDRLRLVFKPQTPEGTLRQLMLEVEGEIVAGPTPRGVYTARLPPGQGREAIALLRQSGQVEFAEPVASSP